MALVPWTYNNPRVDQRNARTRDFIFQGRRIEVVQNVEAEISLDKNTGLKLWDGAFLLARYLESTKTFPATFWRNKRCIELGSGCGLVGIVAWLLGAKVTLTDLPAVVDHTAASVKINTDRLVCEDSNLAARVSNIMVQSYTWGDSTDHISGPFDYVFGSDIVYHPDATENLISSLKLLTGTESVILIAYKPRGLGEEIFFTELKKHGFKSEEISKDCHPPDFKDSDYSIIKILTS